MEEIEVPQPTKDPRRNPRGAHHSRNLAYNTCICIDDCGISCQNRALAIRCDPDNCQRGGLCSNQAPIHSSFPSHEVFQTHDNNGIRGKGFRLRVEVEAKKVIEEYTGKTVKTVEEGDSKGLYILQVDGVLIDGSNGSDAKYINHSCDPNSQIEKWVVLGINKSFIVSKTRILAGEEITIDYGEWYFIECKCGAATCRGWSGRRARPEPSTTELQLAIRETAWEVEEVDWGVRREEIWKMDSGKSTVSPYFR
ncbi:hypothetical protein V8F06_014594 [Rhypophila decipiens]